METNVKKEEYELEQERLDYTYKVVDENIKDLESLAEDHYDSVLKMSEEKWERKSNYFDDARAMQDINNTAIVTNQSVLRSLRKLRRLTDPDELYRVKPYFGKIKVDFDGEEESFYIGLFSISDNNDLIVNDWRSPIASLFYNSRLGNTSYKAPNGMISCNLEQRKQIDIDKMNKRVRRIINSDIHISDEELQEVLSRSSDGKMKNIVTTIQEEQNNIIRNLKDRKIIVQGCAGSGKTSVALHRLAYLLYSDKMANEDNMLIFSPSDAFTSYISNVLPELGENNVMQTTFSDLANAFVKSFDKIESYTEFVSKYYDGLNSEEQNKLNKFKFSKEYKEALDKFIKRNTNNHLFKNDFSYKGITLPKENINKVLLENEDISLQDKVDLITDYLYPFFRKVNIDKKVLRTKVSYELRANKIDPRVLYNKFLVSDEFIEAYGSNGGKLNIHLLEYPDLIGMLYLNFAMMGYPPNDQIHHLVIDEVQDYGPIQLEMITNMFKGATITALGDANQTINPYHKYNSLEEMTKIFGVESKYMELNKAYRSSPEIMEYTNGVIEEANVLSVRQSNNVPVVKKEVKKEDLFTELVTDILKIKESGLKRICIITKSKKEAEAIYEGLKDSVEDISVLCDEDNNKKIYVSPSYNAKGLEFDAVISYNDYNDPYREEDKYLYYVACTRAQHNLVVYNEPKALKKGMN